MKRLAYTIFAAVMLIAATLNASAQSGETRQVSGFNGIASGGPFNVHVKIDGNESLKLSAPADVMKEIETTVENGKLEIKFKRDSKFERNYSGGKIEVYVSAKSLSTITNAGSGAVKVDGELTGDKTNVVLSGSGDITTAVKSDALHAVISGSGSIHLNGTANDANMIITGSGQLMGKELKTGSASTVITGSGTIHLAAEKTISARITGSGNVVYSGTAIVESRTVGSGSVRKEN